MLSSVPCLGVHPLFNSVDQVMLGKMLYKLEHLVADSPPEWPISQSAHQSAHQLLAAVGQLKI